MNNNLISQYKMIITLKKLLIKTIRPRIYNHPLEIPILKQTITKKFSINNLIKDLIMIFLIKNKPLKTYQKKDPILSIYNNKKMRQLMKKY